jgi:hypothetical protein
MMKIVRLLAEYVGGGHKAIIICGVDELGYLAKGEWHGHWDMGATYIPFLFRKLSSNSKTQVYYDGYSKDQGDEMTLGVLPVKVGEYFSVFDKDGEWNYQIKSIHYYVSE